MMRQAPKATRQALPVDVQETKLYLIVDMGCQRAALGFGWLELARAEQVRRFSLHGDVFTETRSFQFGSRGPESSSKSIVSAIGIAG